MKQKIAQLIRESSKVKEQMLKDSLLLEAIELAAVKMVDCFQNDGKILFCGNGGSASDAQHIAAELSGRFYLDRAPLFAEALHVNTSFLTAVSNDYSFEIAYARMVEAAGRTGDVLVAISTSGNSENILNACLAAKKQGMLILGMTGNKKGKLVSISDIALEIPSAITPRIQEGHILVGHILCEIIEEKIFGKNA